MLRKHSRLIGLLTLVFSVLGAIAWIVLTYFTPPALFSYAPIAVGGDVTDIHSISWSPQGNFLLFRGSRNLSSASSQLYVYDQSAGEASILLEAEGSSVFRPVWDSSGDYIVVDTLVPSGPQLFAFPAMTPVEIAWPIDGRPDWIKLDGIGSSAFALSTTERSGVQVLELTNLSLSGNRQNREKILVQEPFVSMRTASMSWANDKLAVSVTLASASLESSVVVYDLSEGFLTTLKRTGVALDSPTWSPDGEWLALTEEDRQSAIVLLRLTDGCEVRQSLPSIGGPTGLSWSRDGSALALSYPSRVYVLPFSAVFGFEYSALEENCTLSE